MLSGFSCSVGILCRVQKDSDKWLISAPSSMRIVAGMPAIRPFAIRRLVQLVQRGLLVHEVQEKLILGLA